MSLLGDRAATGRARLRLLALPIYSGLPTEEQLRVFAPPPPGTRKVVVATNIAETSITIDGIVHVVDCGFVKQRVADPASGHEQLVVTRESQANARQRAGRAGRVRPGCCYVLMTEGDYRALPAHSPPEMARCGLAGVALQLKALGVDNVLRFDFLAPPPPRSLASALELLFALGALDEAGGLTAMGERLSQLPLEPQMGAVLLGAAQLVEGARPPAALATAAAAPLLRPVVPAAPEHPGAPPPAWKRARGRGARGWARRTDGDAFLLATLRPSRSAASTRRSRSRRCSP